MGVLFNLVVMSVLFVSYNAAEPTGADTSTTMDLRGERTTIRRLRRYEYTMKDLDKNDNGGGDEERGLIDVSKLDDALSAKLDALMSSDNIRKALNNIDDEAGLFKKWNQNEDTSKAVLARLQKTSAESPTNADILSKFNTFIMKEKLDDLMSADKIEKALADPKDRDALFKMWYADEATSKSVLARLQRTPADTLANSKIISKFNSFIKKEKELDDLLDPVKIKNGMQNFEGQEALFRTWHVDDATALAVTARLDQNRMPNFPIILKFNDYRTRLHYNEVLAPGMETKMLDESAAALANFDTKPMTKIYQSWYDKGITSTEFTSALNTIKDPNKRKKYVRFERMYGWFTDMKAKEEAAAAAKKAAEAMD